MKFITLFSCVIHPVAVNTRDFPDSFVLLELYRLCFEIMDYLLVQNVFVSENIFGY